MEHPSASIPANMPPFTDFAFNPRQGSLTIAFLGRARDKRFRDALLLWSVGFCASLALGAWIYYGIGLQAIIHVSVVKWVSETEVTQKITDSLISLFAGWAGGGLLFLVWLGYLAFRKVPNPLGRDKWLVIMPSTLKFQGRRYALASLRCLRVEDAPGKKDRFDVLFEHAGKTTALGRRLQQERAFWLVDTLKMLITFRCHDTEQIVFGQTRPAGITSVYSTRFNPDVATLTLPFWRLKQIVIVTKNYDVHLVERFLMYAVSVIGQAYMRNYVTAVLYGDPADLHQDLYNNLKELCADFTVQPTPDSRRGTRESS